MLVGFVFDSITKTSATVKHFKLFRNERTRGVEWS